VNEARAADLPDQKHLFSPSTQSLIAPSELVGRQLTGKRVGRRAGRHQAANERAMPRPRQLESLSTPGRLNVGDEFISRPAREYAPDLGMAA
jgi:hypothetical protein